MPGFEELLAPAPDKVFGIVAKYKEDKRPEKINLAIGAYVDANGRTVCFKAVAEAMSKLAKDPEVGYLNPVGDPEFNALSQNIVFQRSEADECIASVQCLSGTGALYLASQLIQMINPKTTVYISNPSWPLHKTLFGQYFETRDYTYWCDKARGVDFEGMKADLSAAPAGSVILTHACAHNPTGQDLSHDQWDWLFELCKTKKLLLLIDCAYQGFASGEFAADGWAVSRAYEKLKGSTYNFIVCQSFAKNMSLYGYRVGCCHVACGDAATKQKVQGHLANFGRRTWSNPPRIGSDICKTILKDEALKALWLKELKAVSGEITKIRSQIRSKLEELLPGSCWKHLTEQIGMFAYTGLRADQCARLEEEFAIYLLSTGRISLAGIQQSQIEPICQAIAKVCATSSPKAAAK